MGPPVANSYPFLNGSLAYFYSWTDTLSVQLPQLRWPGLLPPSTTAFPGQRRFLSALLRIRLLVQSRSKAGS